MALLRKAGTLTEDTIKDYYGEKRFEQVTESNAIEGSTLSAGETELAVLKGITITGHDPAYVRDAISLDRALCRIADLARDRAKPTDIEQLQEVHSLILGEREGGGLFRNQPVKITGSKHKPPQTWKEIIDQMEQWERWSKENPSLPAPIRSIVLHAWMTHIHPYIDGNGRTARAISNLELIRFGYPPVIIKKKERDRYIESLGESDEAGDLQSFSELIFEKLEGSLTGLENSAKRKQGFDPVVLKIRLTQENQLKVWVRSVQLLAAIIEQKLGLLLEAVGGTCYFRSYDSALDIDDYVELCGGRNVPMTWAFKLRIDVPGLKRLEKLAYVAHRSARMHQYNDRKGGPSLYWSSKNQAGTPQWTSNGSTAPYATEITIDANNGDDWFAKLADDSITSMKTTKLGEQIAKALFAQLAS